MSSKKTLLVFISVFLFACVFIFQNCAEDIEMDKYGSQSTPSSTPGPSPTPTPTPTPTGSVPTITTQPVNRLVTYLSAFELSVVATGGSLQYTWFKDGSPITDATSASYVVSSAQTTHSGRYHVEVRNSFGSVTSNAIDVLVNRGADQYPPAIAVGLQNVQIIYNFIIANPNPLILRVSATSLSPVTYEWYFRRSGSSTETRLTAATATYSVSYLAGQTANHLGEYRVVVRNAYGSVESRAQVTGLYSNNDY